MGTVPLHKLRGGDPLPTFRHNNGLLPEAMGINNKPTIEDLREVGLVKLLGQHDLGDACYGEGGIIVGATLCSWYIKQNRHDFHYLDECVEIAGAQRVFRPAAELFYQALGILRQAF